MQDQDDQPTDHLTSDDDLLDEPLTDEERAHIEEGLADVEAGRTVPHAEVMAMIQKWRKAK